MRPDARTALTLSFLAVCASLASSRGAIVALGALGLEALAARVGPRLLARRLVPLASGFALLLVLLPLARRAVLDVSLRGLAVGTAGVVLGTITTWSDTISALQGAGLPRGAVAFLVILARHAEGVREDANQAYRALATRGGFDRLSSIGRASGVLVARVLDRTLHRAERVAQALELRGFEGRVPELPRWRPRIAEAPFYALTLLLTAMTVVEVGTWKR